MDLELKGKVALVTGSSKGIGRAIAQTLHDEGCRVVLNARGREELTNVCEAMGLDPVKHTVSGDVTHPDACGRIVDEVLRNFGRLDVLVCNVGSGHSVPPGSETAEEWERVFRLNLFSVTNMVQAATPALAESKGAIVCVSSICGIEVVSGAPVTYSAAKAALNAYVRGIARPLGKCNVRINAVAPGNVLFEGSVWERKLREDRGAVNTMLERDVSLATLGSAQDIAGLVGFLASPRAAFATGEVYVLDGGQVHS